jgi:hypothetical protein
MDEILAPIPNPRGGERHNLSKKNPTKSMQPIRKSYCPIGNCYCAAHAGVDVANVTAEPVRVT